MHRYTVGLFVYKFLFCFDRKGTDSPWGFSRLTMLERLGIPFLGAFWTMDWMDFGWTALTKRCKRFLVLGFLRSSPTACTMTVGGFFPAGFMRGFRDFFGREPAKRRTNVCFFGSDLRITSLSLLIVSGFFGLSFFGFGLNGAFLITLMARLTSCGLLTSMMGFSTPGKITRNLTFFLGLSRMSLRNLTIFFLIFSKSFFPVSGELSTITTTSFPFGFFAGMGRRRWSHTLFFWLMSYSMSTGSFPYMLGSCFRWLMQQRTKMRNFFSAYVPSNTVYSIGANLESTSVNVSCETLFFYLRFNYKCRFGFRYFYSALFDRLTFFLLFSALFLSFFESACFYSFPSFLRFSSFLWFDHLFFLWSAYFRWST